MSRLALDIALVTTANDKFINSMMGIDFHDVPKNGVATNCDHGLGLKVSLFRDSSAKAPS